MATKAHSTDPGSPERAIHRVEGVLFEPLSGRALVLGSGLEVFEIVRTWLNVGRDWERLTAAYHWLTFDHLRAALGFYEKNTAVVDERLELERKARVEDVWERNPKSRPPRR